MRYALVAFASGVAMEALYALGVIVLASGRVAASGAVSVAWGGAVLLGVNEAFRTWVAAVAWCLGLGVGTVVGATIGKRLRVAGGPKEGK